MNLDNGEIRELIEHEELRQREIALTEKMAEYLRQIDQQERPLAYSRQARRDAARRAKKRG